MPDVETVVQVMRTINFTWGFILFIGLTYFGIKDLIYSHECSQEHQPYELQLWAGTAWAAVLTLCLSTGEILFTQVVSFGFRTFLPIIFLIPCSFALREGRRRVKLHGQSIRMGLCK